MSGWYEKFTDLYVVFLKHCFLELSTETQAVFWEHVGNYENARKQTSLSPYDKELGFNGSFICIVIEI